MSPATARTLDLLDAVGEATGRLGVDAGAELAALRDFLAGPPVVAVVGLPHQERGSLAAALAGALTAATVREYDPAAHAANPLWDMLVLVTPADRALSGVEEALVRAAVEQRRPALVVLSRVHVLGADPAAVAEVERFRLRPALGILGVHWHVDDAGAETRAAVAADVASRLRPSSDHSPAGKLALRAILDRVLAQFDDLRAARERAIALLSTVEKQLPASVAHVYELARLNRLAVADRLRAGEDGLYDVAVAAADAALDWATAEGIAPWADVERPVRQAWQRLVDQTREVLPEHAELLRDGLARTRDNLLEAISHLDVEVSAPAITAGSWETPATREALGLLLDVDIEPVLRRFERQARGQLPKDKRKEPDHDDPGVAASAVDRAAEVGKRIEEGVRRRTSSPYNPLRIGVHTDLRAVAGQRIAEAHEAMREAAAAGGDTAADDAAKGLRDLVGKASDAVNQRHSWHGAYGDLRALRAQS